MKNLIILFLLISIQSFSQTSYKKGYFLTKDSKKNEVYIMALGNTIPKTIFYKISPESEEISKISIDNLSELSISNTTQFVRKNVRIEILEMNMQSTKANNTKAFNLTEKELFLKVLLKFDDFILYSYSDNKSGNTYFFTENQNKITLLEFKKFESGLKTITVDNFKRQLFDNYKISFGESKLTLKNIKYKEKDFIQYFSDFAKNQNKTVIKNKDFNRDFKDVINFTPKIGFSITNHTTTIENQFQTNLNTTTNSKNINIGFDFEYFLKNPKKTSSFIFSFTYYFNNDKDGEFGLTQSNGDSTINHDFDPSFQIKYRRYFPLNKNQYLFLNIGTQISSGSTNYTYISSNLNFADLKFSNQVSFSIGAGYTYKNFQLDVDFCPSINGDYNSFNEIYTRSDWTFSRNIISFSLGYNIF